MPPLVVALSWEGLASSPCSCQGHLEMLALSWVQVLSAHL